MEDAGRGRRRAGRHRRHCAEGFFYLLLPILVVPLAWYWAFAVAWFGFLMLTIVTAIRSPYRALIVPPVALVVVVVWLTIGQNYLGWAP